MDRKLASIQIISAISPIPDADAIEVATVLGWKCVVKKGEFKEGDLIVYFEVDSFLSEKTQFEFLRKSCFRKNEILGSGFHIKTIKLRGQVSQGLVLSSKEALAGVTVAVPIVEGFDVTDIIGVKKWFLPEIESEFGTEIPGKVDGVPTTAETRVQSIPDMLTLFAGKPYYITTKMDGTSCSISCVNGVVEAMGHSNRYVEDPVKCPLWGYIYRRNIKEKLLKFGKNIVIQGEFCGPNIRKNRMRLLAPEWYIFDIVDLDTGSYYGIDALRQCCKELGLTTVPVEERGDSFNYTTVEELLARAEGKYSSGMEKEGIVIRTQQPMYAVDLQNRYSFKVLNNKFLLKED